MGFHLSKLLIHRGQGVTLLEMLVYITLVSILVLAFVGFALDVIGTAQKARVKQEVQQNARFAMARMIYEIRSANGLNTGSSTFGSHPGVLSLATSTPVTNPTVFDVSNGRLRIKQGASAAQDLTSSKLTVSNLVFTNRSVSGRTSNVKIELTIEHPNPENIEIFDVAVSLKGSAVIRKSGN